MTARALRIFISSPGDVAEERHRASRVLQRLQGEFTRYVILEPILWEHEPMRATRHFQEQIILPSQTDIVVCILWSRLGTRMPPGKFKRDDGTPYLSGTEFEFEDAARAYREKGTPDLLVFRKTSEPLISLNNERAIQERLEQKKALEAFWNRWFGNPLDAFQAAFTLFETPEQFARLLEDHLRKLIRDRLPQHLVDEPEPRRWTKDISPYRGLEAFTWEHTEVFCGRQRAISAVIEALTQQAERGCAFVLVFGMSGCGKSSLVRAGVLPALADPGIVGVDLWRDCIFRPSDASSDLYDGLARALCTDASLPELHTLTSAADLASLFRDAPQHSVTLVRAALQRAAEAEQAKTGLGQLPEARLALVVDQLEELFTLEWVHAKARANFVAVLSALAHSGFVWVITTMRSDFYPRCVELRELVRLKEGDGQYDLLPPTAAEMADMIRSPARAAALRFEVKDGLSLENVLHEAAADNPTALPLLEFTLDELYKQRADGVLTFDAYERLGGGST
jgi:Novel STAND NTPase 1